jgi:hypothetical protein
MCLLGSISVKSKSSIGCGKMALQGQASLGGHREGDVNVALGHCGKSYRWRPHRLRDEPTGQTGPVKIIELAAARSDPQQVEQPG